MGSPKPPSHNPQHPPPPGHPLSPTQVGHPRLRVPSRGGRDGDGVPLGLGGCLGGPPAASATPRNAGAAAAIPPGPDPAPGRPCGAQGRGFLGETPGTSRGFPRMAAGAGEVRVSPRVPACVRASPRASPLALWDPRTPPGWERARSCVGQITHPLCRALPLRTVPNALWGDTGCPGDGDLAAGVTRAPTVTGLGRTVPVLFGSPMASRRCLRQPRGAQVVPNPPNSHSAPPALPSGDSGSVTHPPSSPVLAFAGAPAGTARCSPAWDIWPGLGGGGRCGRPRNRGHHGGFGGTGTGRRGAARGLTHFKPRAPRAGWWGAPLAPCGGHGVGPAAPSTPSVGGGGFPGSPAPSPLPSTAVGLWP